MRDVAILTKQKHLHGPVAVFIVSAVVTIFLEVWLYRDKSLFVVLIPILAFFGLFAWKKNPFRNSVSAGVLVGIVVSMVFAFVLKIV
jgi:nicotinamide riboside transporter PnuC